MSIRSAFALLLAGLVIAGCSGSSSDNIGATNPESGNGAPPAPPAGVGSFVPLFRPTSGVLPFPVDLYFAGTTDGTLNLPASLQNFTPHFAALNALDGYSTTSDITLRFSAAIDPATLAANVRVVRVAIDNATKATVGVLGILFPGTDYSIGVSPDIDTGGSTLLIRPLRPLVRLDRRHQQRLPGPRHEWGQEHEWLGSNARHGLPDGAHGGDRRPDRGVNPPTCSSMQLPRRRPAQR